MSKMQVSIVTTTAKAALTPALNPALKPAALKPDLSRTLARSSNPLLSYIDAIGAAVCKAVDSWAATASLVEVVVNGPIATGGMMIGPAVGGLVQGYAPDAPWREHTMAIASGLESQIQQFQSTVRVPGLAWFPAFAAYPGPVTPPMVATPTPLVVLAGGAGPLLDEPALRLAFASGYRSAKPAQADELASALAQGLAAAFKVWLPTTMVTNVIGWGHVPTFAPPYVPVGPVVNGRAMMQPGGLV
jgi:hypothetical protein